MAYFHYRCGERIHLSNENCTATRNRCDFDHGLVLSAEPLVNDVPFEIRIDRRVNLWSGSVEMGIIETDPLTFEFPAGASHLGHPSWIMMGRSIVINGLTAIESYGSDLDNLYEGDRLAVMRTSQGELVFFINGESQGVAAVDIPPVVYVLVDLYGKCIQVSVTNPALERTHNNDECLSGSSVLAIENDALNVTLGGDLSELSMSSNSNSLDIRMDMNVSINIPDESALLSPTSAGATATTATAAAVAALSRMTSEECRIGFHERCGTLVKLSNSRRTAEGRRPLDEFNNGVVMTNRPLMDGELFEIRIDRLVDKWSGSIEIGVTTHNPNMLLFPATMTNMRSGTIMMSGCGILTNGKGTRREYGDFNLDELREGDRVGMMRKANGNLHFFINGLDQGVAAHRVNSIVWGVIDLYGMTIKVSIMDRSDRELPNMVVTRSNGYDNLPSYRIAMGQYNTGSGIEERDFVTNHLPADEATAAASSLSEFNETPGTLVFHRNCGTHVRVINNGRTAQRPNAVEDFNNGVVLTARPLRPNEVFEIRLDRIVTKWAGSIEIGVTTHDPTELDFPFTMTNVRSGTWMMTGGGVMHNGIIVLDQYGVNLDSMQVGDRVGVFRKSNGDLHFLVNGVDQGVAATNVPPNIYGVVDLYGQAVEATIIDENALPELTDSQTDVTAENNACAQSSDKLQFHRIHGQNVRIIRGGLTAIRPKPLAEFNHAIVFSSRPIEDGEMFEVVLEQVVDRWSGSIELGITATQPDNILLPSTATDLLDGTWMLSGSNVMRNGKTIKTNYSCDLDTLACGARLGLVYQSTIQGGTLEFYLDGYAQGVACTGIGLAAGEVYAVVDLYGQCAQVSIIRNDERCRSGAVPVQPLPILPCVNIAPNNEISTTDAPLNVITVPDEDTQLHTWSNHFCGKFITLAENGRLAKRALTCTQDTPTTVNSRSLENVVFSATPLVSDELFEVIVSFMHDENPISSIVMGIGIIPSPDWCYDKLIRNSIILRNNEMRLRSKLVQFFTPSLTWLNDGDRLATILTDDNNMLKFLLNGEQFASICLNSLRCEASILTSSRNLYVWFNMQSHCSFLDINSHHTVPPAFVTTTLAPPPPKISLSSSYVIGENNGHREVEVEPLPEEVVTIGPSTPVYEFLENHGRNIELSAGRRTATRVASYNQGVVLVRPPLDPYNNSCVEVMVEELDTRWQSSLMVGVICCATPDRLNLPVHGLAMSKSSLAPPACVIANDWILHNGTRYRSRYGFALNHVQVGDRIGISVNEGGHLTLLFNGKSAHVQSMSVSNGTIGTPSSSMGDYMSAPPDITRSALLAPKSQPPRHAMYAMFDLYGKCKQISLTNQGRGKLCAPQLTLGTDPGVVSGAQISNSSKFLYADNSMSSSLVSSCGSGPSAAMEPAPSSHCAVVNNKEKADLEICEKEQSHLTLPLLTQSNAIEPVSSSRSTETVSTSMAIPSVKPGPTPQVVTPVPLNTASVFASPMISFCDYKQLCEEFWSKLLLPKQYFINEDHTCYCSDCVSKERQDDVTEPKHSDADESTSTHALLDWVRFPLKHSIGVSGTSGLSTNNACDKWHIAYYPCKLNAIRCILDSGEPLRHGQQTVGHFVRQKEDDVQVTFYPDLVKCPCVSTANDGRQVRVVFELRVKPGAYSVVDTGNLADAMTEIQADTNDNTHAGDTLANGNSAIDSGCENNCSVTRTTQSITSDSFSKVVHWSTKESGAIVLHSLLIQMIE